MNDQPADSRTTVKTDFVCSSGDGTKLIVDSAAPSYPKDVAIQVRNNRGQAAWVLVSPETARQIAAAILRCATHCESQTDAE